jgi:hypothetical protein
MKINSINIILLLSMLPACTTVYTKDTSGGIALYNSLGGDSQGISISPDRSEIAENKNSQSFSKAATVIGSMYSIGQLANVTKNMHNQTGATDRAAIASKTSQHSVTTEAGVKQAEIGANLEALKDNNATSIELEKIRIPNKN